MELRPYQKEAVDRGVSHFRNYDKPAIISLPTGSGKSFVIAGIANEINDHILILQPTKEILQQNVNKMKLYGFNDIQIYSASFNSKEIGQFTYATIGSIYKKPQLFKHFKYVLIDECHTVNPKNSTKKNKDGTVEKEGGMYNQFFEAMGSPAIIGLTASPYRIVNKFITRESDGQLFYTGHLQMLNRIHPFFFGKIIYKVENHELITQGYLSKPTYVFPDEDFDMSQIKINTTGNDFDDESMDKYTTSLKRLEKIVGSVYKYYNERNYFLIFASSVKQANELSDILSNAGYDNEVVFGHTPAAERDRVIENFRKGKVRIVINVNVLSIGFDFPELDCIILGRPTISLALFYQQVGRGFRIHPEKKDFLVVDCVNIVKKLGLPDTISITKESDGFRDRVETDVGVLTNKPLFTFLVKDKEKRDKLLVDKSKRLDLTNLKN